MTEKSNQNNHFILFFYMMLFLTPSIAMISGLFIAAWVALIMVLYIYLTRIQLAQIYKNFLLSERGLMLWGIFSSLWSIGSRASLAAASKLILTIVCVHLVRSNYHLLKIPRNYLISGIFLSFVLVIAVFLIEKHFSGCISLAIRGVFQPYKDHYFALYWLDRGSALLSLFSWAPIYLLLAHRKRLLALIVYLATLSILLTSDSDSSVLAFLLAGIVFLFSYFANAKLLLAIPVAIISYVIVMPIIAKIIDPEYISQIWGNILPMSYIHRIFIWNFAINGAMDSLLIGKGIDASKYLANEGATFIVFKGITMSLMPRHPHNNVIQIFLELGLVGLCLLSSYIWQIMSCFIKIHKKERIYSSILIAVFINYFVIGMISFNLWQAWWLMVIVYLALILSFVRDEQNR